MASNDSSLKATASAAACATAPPFATAATARAALRRLGPPALAGAIATLFACSSSSPLPPSIGACKSTGGAPCPGGTPGGGASPPSDAGPPELEAGVGTEAGNCPGVMQIFSAAASSCATCAETNCCSGATSCPNDPACLQIAECVTTSCLQNDPSCLATCEAASPTGSVTEYIDFQQCVGSNCPGCPALAPGDL